MAAALAKAASVLGAPKTSASGPLQMGDKTSIWARLVEQSKTQAKAPGENNRPDANLYFVGSRQGGKSTLLNRFLYPDKVDSPKPTGGMEYTYARKSVATNIERKDIAHIWELSGPDELVEHITGSESLFLGQRHVSTSVVVVVIDLGKPAEALKTLVSWLDKIKTRVAATYEKLERRGSRLPEQLRNRARRAFGTNHEDRDSVAHTGVSIVVVGARYDLFEQEDAELRKVMARALRYVAHTNGASLIYTSGLGADGASRGAKAVSQDKALMANLRSTLNHLVFSGPEKLRGALKLPVEVDHMKPLVVPAGGDVFKDIGRPRGQGSDGASAGLDEWSSIFAKLFPSQAQEENSQLGVDREKAKHAETEVDAARKRKDEELEAYRRQQKMVKDRWAVSKAKAAASKS